MNAITIVCLVLGAKELVVGFLRLLERASGEELLPRLGVRK